MMSMLFLACLTALMIGATPVSGCTMSFISTHQQQNARHSSKTLASRASSLLELRATRAGTLAARQRRAGALPAREPDPHAAVDQARRADRRRIRLDEIRRVEQILRAEEDLDGAPD